MPTPINPINAIPQSYISDLPNNNVPHFPPNQNPSLEDSLGQTNFDLENRFPFGGPINDPNSNFCHFYTPQKPYTITPQGRKEEGKLKFTPPQTNLDVESPLPNGGPINIPYTTRIGNETRTFTTTQPNTPKKTYADSFNPIPPGILR